MLLDISSELALLYTGENTLRLVRPAEPETVSPQFSDETLLQLTIRVLSHDETRRRVPDLWLPLRRRRQASIRAEIKDRIDELRHKFGAPSQSRNLLYRGRIEFGGRVLLRRGRGWQVTAPGSSHPTLTWEWLANLCALVCRDFWMRNKFHGAHVAILPAYPASCWTAEGILIEGAQLDLNAASVSNPQTRPQEISAEPLLRALLNSSDEPHSAEVNTLREITRRSLFVLLEGGDAFARHTFSLSAVYPEIARTFQSAESSAEHVRAAESVASDLRRERETLRFELHAEKERYNTLRQSKDEELERLLSELADRERSVDAKAHQLEEQRVRLELMKARIGTRLVEQGIGATNQLSSLYVVDQSVLDQLSSELQRVVHGQRNDARLQALLKQLKHSMKPAIHLMQ